MEEESNVISDSDELLQQDVQSKRKILSLSTIIPDAQKDELVSSKTTPAFGIRQGLMEPTNAEATIKDTVWGEISRSYSSTGHAVYNSQKTDHCETVNLDVQMLRKVFGENAENVAAAFLTCHSVLLTRMLLSSFLYGARHLGYTVDKWRLILHSQAFRVHSGTRYAKKQQYPMKLHHHGQYKNSSSVGSDQRGPNRKRKVKLTEKTKFAKQRAEEQRRREGGEADRAPSLGDGDGDQGALLTGLTAAAAGGQDRASSGLAHFGSAPQLLAIARTLCETSEGRKAVTLLTVGVGGWGAGTAPRAGAKRPSGAPASQCGRQRCEQDARPGAVRTEGLRSRRPCQFWRLKSKIKVPAWSISDAETDEVVTTRGFKHRTLWLPHLWSSPLSSTASSSQAAFLTLAMTTDILPGKFFVWDGKSPTHCRIFNSTPVFYSLDTDNIFPLWTTVSRPCQMSNPEVKVPLVEDHCLSKVQFSFIPYYSIHFQFKSRASIFQIIM
ncbi:uncharacterized protein [Macaca fascicularis]|uniref:uncharacterized protein n=1 Tax=Macaca fascicularis TaxID=9541 RepID=UPI0032B03C7E